MATASAWVGHGWSFLSSGSAYGQRGMGDGGRYPFTTIHFLGFSFFPPVFWFPSRWVTRFGPSLGGPGDELTFLVSFFTDAADDGPGGETVSRRWWRVCFQITYLFLFWPLPQKYTLESGTRRTERNRLPRMHTFLGFHFPELRDSDVGVSLVYPHSIRYPPGLYLDQVARQYENCFFSFKKVPRHTDCRRGCRCPRPRSGRITACKAERPDAMEGRGPSMGRELTDS